MNAKQLLRRENAIIRGLDGLTIEDMKQAARMYRNGHQFTTDHATNDKGRRLRRAYVVLATINKLPGRQWFGISVSNPTIHPDANK